MDTQYADKGGVRIHPGDDRTLVYEPPLGAAPIDWETGYDIRNTLGGDIKIKNQFQSLSCVGQGSSYYFWVLQVLEMMTEYGMNLEQLRQTHPDEVEEVSAKAIYSQIYIKLGGGSWIYKAMKLGRDWGALHERHVPSYKADGTTDEKFMRDETWKTEALKAIAKILQGKNYAVITAKTDMDLYASAIMQNFGVVGALAGQNGHGWNTMTPKPPSDPAKYWHHCIYFGAFGKDEKGKYIATPNSWGPKSNETWYQGAKPGIGWQRLYVDYFGADKNGNAFQSNPYTFQDKPNPKYQDDMLKLIKGDQSPKVYVVGKDGKLMHVESIPALNRGAEAGMWVPEAEIEELPQESVDAMPKSYSVGFSI